MHATQIIVAHRLSTIKNVDRVIVIDKGQIIENGGFDELVAKGGIFASMVYTIARNAVADYRRKAYVNRESEMDESVELISRADKYYFDDPDSLKYVENRELFNILCMLTDAEKDFLGLRYGL